MGTPAGPGSRPGFRRDIGPTAVPGRDYVVAGILALISFIVYIFLPVGWLHCDTMPVAQDIGEPWTAYLGMHPHHLLTFPLAKAGYDIASAVYSWFRPDGELAPLIWLQMVSRFSGSVCVGITYVAIRKIYPRTLYALPTTIACAFAYSFLHFSLDGCRYMAVLFWVWLAYFLLPWRPAPLKAYLPAIGMYAVSTLMHQLSVFTIFALVVHGISFGESQEASSKERTRSAVRIGLISLGAVVIPYALIGGYASWAYFHLAEQTQFFQPKSFLDMLLYYGTHGETYWAENMYDGFIQDALAFLPLWIPRHLTYLGLHVPLATLASLGPGIISVWTALIFRRMPSYIRRVTLITLGAMLPFFIFQIWYAPWFYFFKLFIFLPLLIFLVSGLEAIRQRQSSRAAGIMLAMYWIWVALLVWVNLGGLQYEWQAAGIAGPF